MKNISVIGGDMRQITLCNLLKNDHFSVLAYGMGEYFENSDLNEIYSSDVIVFPMPVCAGTEFLNAPLSGEEIPVWDILNNLKKPKLVLGGKIPKDICDYLEEREIPYADYLKREELAVKNAVPTAEGAIEIAMGELPITLWGSQCLIIGYGRIARVLARMLRGIGAQVSVAARRYEALAWIEADGYQALPIAQLAREIHKFDVIFNTAPSLVIDRPMLKRTAKDALLIDLASKPGGIDFASAKEENVKVIWALSLPGKVAPLTSGAILKDTIINILTETGV